MKTTLLALLCLSLVPVSAADATIVQTVDQPVTDETKTWSHSVEEAGDYQIGVAWIEVIEGKQDVTVEILKNSELVKKLQAPVGQVTRLETRIENLASGDQITVTALTNGSSYRVGYKIAFGTPTFEGLPVFDVHDPAYGAVGDGTTDDFAAIQAAVTAAINAGGGIVQFDGTRTYRAIGLNDATIENLIELAGVSNIKVEGNGATIMLHPPDRLVLVESSENIQIDGFTVSYDPLPYYQGTIDAIDVENLTADITVPERYEVPVVGTNTIPPHAPFFAFTFIPETPGSRAGDGRHLYIESTETIGGDPRRIRLHGDSDTTATSPAAALQHALDNGATEIIVPHRDYGHRGGFSIDVQNSSRVTVSNVRFYLMPHLGILPGKNVGPVTFSNVDLLMENPATELLWSWRGAYSVSGHNRWGFLIEDGEWHGCAMYDDVLAFFMRRQDILGISGQTLSLELGEYADLFREGDWISIWTEGQTELRGMSRITGVGKKKADGTFDVTLESVPPGTVVNDVAINEELYNRDTVVRNCRNYPQGASPATTRLRTGGHFINCEFENTYLKTEFVELFHPVRARNFVLENSTLKPSKWNRIRFDAAINPKIIGCTLDDTYVLGDKGAEDIHLEGNAWTNMSGDIVDLDHGSSAWLFGNSIRNGSASGLDSHVSVDGTSSITYATPPNYPPAQPPLSSGFAPSVAPTLTAVAGEGSGAGHPPLTEPGETFVFSVDQAVTSEPKRWTHRVAEAGDFQLGMAWLEVQSGEEVEVTIMAAGKVVKSLKAQPGLAPGRMETRIENLAAGDEITVTATPKRASYRLGYQIAFGTPTFPGAKVFHVKDFGALGDGETDDFATIRKAVAAARESGCGIVRFEGSKTYRVVGLNDFTEESVLDLKGARNIKVEGHGATMLLHPPDSFAAVDKAENIQIDGFTIDYDPRPYYQGMIKKIDLETMTVDIEVPERYPVPEIGKNTFRAPFFGRSFIPDAPAARSGHGHNIYVEEVTRFGNDRQLRLHIRKEAKGSDNPSASMKPRLQHAHDHGATEFVVPHVKYAHRGGATRITHSSRVKFSNLRYVGVPHFWLAITHNMGPITLSNVDLQTPNPETELFVSWRDGMHIKNGRWGILIEDGDWDGAAMYDDTFAIYSRAQKAVAVAGNTITLTPTFLQKEVFLWQEGDWASVWTLGQKQLRGMSRVVRVEGKTGNNTFHVKLESMPAGSSADDVVLHEESLNRGSVVRNCRTTDVGTENSSTRFRCVDVRFENNKFEDFHFWFHAGPNGPRPRDIVLDRNIISDLRGSSVNLDQGLRCTLRGNTLDGVTIRCNGCQGIHLDGNTFTNMTREIVNLKKSEAWLFGATKVNGRRNHLSNHVKASDTSTIHFETPKITP